MLGLSALLTHAESEDFDSKLGKDRAKLFRE